MLHRLLSLSGLAGGTVAPQTTDEPFGGAQNPARIGLPGRNKGRCVDRNGQPTVNVQVFGTIFRGSFFEKSMKKKNIQFWMYLGLEITEDY